MINRKTFCKSGPRSNDFAEKLTVALAVALAE